MEQESFFLVNRISVDLIPNLRAIIKIYELIEKIQFKKLLMAYVLF